jgi:heme ABC exporter ATP-binding subunit CcmA
MVRATARGARNCCCRSRTYTARSTIPISGPTLRNARVSPPDRVLDSIDPATSAVLDGQPAVSYDFDRVDVAEVSRHYGRRKAVSRVSLALGTGEIIGLLGPNGAGKSTLLGMLATLVAPTSGRITYGGATASERGEPIRARIGVLAHELHLYPELTAHQNLEFFAKLHRRFEPALIDAALESAGLGDRGDDAVASFSRGMRQRLALERTLLHGPRLVLLDEPFTGLDDRAVRVVAARLKQIAAGGAIVVLATHDLDVADGLITRMAVVRGGRLLSDAAAVSGVRQQYRALVESA